MRSSSIYLIDTFPVDVVGNSDYKATSAELSLAIIPKSLGTSVFGLNFDFETRNRIAGFFDFWGGGGVTILFFVNTKIIY